MIFTIYCDEREATFVACQFEGTDVEANAEARRLNELVDENCPDYYIRYYVDPQDILQYRIDEAINLAEEEQKMKDIEKLDDILDAYDPKDFE